MTTSPLMSRLKRLSTSSVCIVDDGKVVKDDTGIVLARHKDLWFDDGSIICRAQDTLFRVHISQLARRSVYFRDMFAVPHSHTCDAVKERYEGLCELGVDVDTTPVIRLHDSAEDVGNLLKALYDGPDFGDNSQKDFCKVSGILRLSHKYIIDSLKAKALAHLSVAWPTNLKAWDMREDIARIYELETNGRRFYPHPIAVINLAREVDAPSLLPAAFYDLSRRSFAQIFEAQEGALNLSMNDIQRLCLGKEAQQQGITALIQAMGNSPQVRQGQQYHAIITQTHGRRHSGSVFSSGICISAATCRKDFSELVDLATQHYLFDRERGCYDPLYVAEELGQLKSAEFSECVACARTLESWAARERERLWKLIPQWFRLE